MRIFGENRLFVGTTAGLYSYFLFKSPLPRKSDIVEGFREIPGVFDVSISGLSGTAVVDGQAFANSNTVVVGLKSGLQYGVQEGNIVKVVPAGNQLAII